MTDDHRGTVPDFERWKKKESFPRDWDKRAKFIVDSGYVHDAEVVLDIGCGAHMALEAQLPSGCLYIPADMCERDERTIVLDLNGKRLPEVDPQDNYFSLIRGCERLEGGRATRATPVPGVSRITTVCMFGVIEYILNVPRLVGWLPSFGAGTNLVFTYGCTDEHPVGEGVRSKGQWLNALSHADICSIFVGSGLFELCDTSMFVPYQQRVYRMVVRASLWTDTLK